MTYRSRAFLDLAHEMQSCKIQIPGTCTGIVIDGLEPVHGDHQWLGRGIGHKSADIFAAGCHSCGQAMHTGRLTREGKADYWQRGAILTMAFLLENGWLRIAPKSQRMALHR